MLKDFGTKERRAEHLKQLKRKWTNESKKYQENIEHMKEFREEQYRKRNEELLQRYKRKQKNILNSLEKRQQNKMKEKEKALSILMEKEKAAQDKVKTRLVEQEKSRLNLEHDTFDKSKSIYILIFF